MRNKLEKIINKAILTDNWSDTPDYVDQIMQLIIEVIPEEIETNGDKDASELDQDWIKGKQHGYNKCIKDIKERINE